MKVLFDTSVLVAGMVSELPHHDRAAPLLRRALIGELSLHIACHALAESYSTLTSLPVSPRISPGQAGELIRRNILESARVVELGLDDYRSAIDRMIRFGLSGGAIHDALHVCAAEKANVKGLYTFNGRDFRRMPPRPPVELIVL